MFRKLMNSYYYGKSGKGDFTPENLPRNRYQLFWEMLRVRFSALFRLNLMYVLPWLPTMIVLFLWASGMLISLSEFAAVESPELFDLAGFQQYAKGSIFQTLVLLIPCILITGPFTAGVAYVTRNWARDEHAFIWSDFKDAVKANWKQSLVISGITAVLPIISYVCWTFYGQMAANTPLMVIPQVVILMVCILWFMALTYFYPLIVTYKLTLPQVLRNGFLLSIARLPMSFGIRLLHCVPTLALGALALFVTQPHWCMLALFAYYVVLGFALSRFVSASFTNAVFDRYINNRIEGAQVGRGLNTEPDDDDEDLEE